MAAGAVLPEAEPMALAAVAASTAAALAVASTVVEAEVSTAAAAAVSTVAEAIGKIAAVNTEAAALWVQPLYLFGIGQSI
jgi:hypothetical protein